MSHTLFSTKYESKDYDSIENELSLVLNVFDTTTNKMIPSSKLTHHALSTIYNL